MVDAQPYSKLTIIIETGDVTQTTEFPTVYNLDWSPVYTDPEIDWTGTKMTRSPELVGMELTFGMLKNQDGHTHTIKYDRKEPEAGELSKTQENSPST